MVDAQQGGEVSEKPAECPCCEFPTEALKLHYATDSIGKFEGRQNWLCDLCSATMAGKTVDRPMTYEGQVETLRTVCYVGNAILAKLQAIESRLDEQDEVLQLIYREAR